MQSVQLSHPKRGLNCGLENVNCKILAWNKQINQSIVKASKVSIFLKKISKGSNIRQTQASINVTGFINLATRITDMASVCGVTKAT